jgi:hypothetical protein
MSADSNQEISVDWDPGERLWWRCKCRCCFSWVTGIHSLVIQKTLTEHWLSINTSEHQHIHIINGKQLYYIASSVFVASWFKLQQCYNLTWSFHAPKSSNSLHAKFIASMGFINVHCSPIPCMVFIRSMTRS